MELAAVAGQISVECWVREKQDISAYALVVKWESQDHFKAWLSGEGHAEGHKLMVIQSDRPVIKKTAFQFETMEM